jgi:hypothetical protein
VRSIRSKRRDALRHAIFAAKVYHGMTVLSRKKLRIAGATRHD